MRIRKVIGSRWSAKRLAWVSGALLLLIIFWASLPSKLFDDPYSTVVYDRHGAMIGARIAADGQWRFPPQDTVPGKFSTCLVQFEDRYFYYHPGFNPGSLARALWQNITAGRIVSGGSTLTMQTIRLHRKGRPRTVMEKLVEIWLALRLELSNSKSEILALYTSHAPFGGNTVGLGAASWRYFERPSDELSWAEAATLAVLPNSPAAIHPGRNRGELLEKRNRLLERLHQRGFIDRMTCDLACEEPLPEKPRSLPDLAPHFTEAVKKGKGSVQYISSIDAKLQAKVTETAKNYQEILAGNRIYNAAILVLDLNTDEVLAYIGNTAAPQETEHSPGVDIITAPRSSGSILKPFLYAAMLDAGDLLPGMLVPDVPSYFAGYSPKNFSQTYDGAVPASQALSRSLNIPAVYLLKEYGVQPFYDLLKKLGMSTLQKPASHYGLSLILGGAEVTLWDACWMYAGLALNGTPSQSGRIVSPNKTNDLSDVFGMESLFDPSIYSAGAAWLTLDALRDVNRPEEEEGWRAFASSREIAWKTGTSFGFRDAWSIGLTSDYLVGVWVGNADGEGRPGLTGVSAAAPLMFEVFRLLPASKQWFRIPFDELERVGVCRQSGHRPSVYCPDIDSVYITLKGLNSPPCPYHRAVQLDEGGKFRVNADCYPADKIMTQPWFILPPAMAHYYRFRDPFYKDLPPLQNGCADTRQKMMQLIYPSGNQKILIPAGNNNAPGEVVFEAAHSRPSAIIYWHLDGEYLGFTRDIHKISLALSPGLHTLVLVDENGERVERGIDVVD